MPRGKLCPLDFKVPQSKMNMTSPKHVGLDSDAVKGPVVDMKLHSNHVSLLRGTLVVKLD